MKIAIGCDPNARQAKEELIRYMNRDMGRWLTLAVMMLSMRKLLSEWQKRLRRVNMTGGF